MIEHLDDGPLFAEPAAFAGPDNPMRVLTREVAFDGQWTSERAAMVSALFDSMAEGWSATHGDEVRTAPIRDALERGGVADARQWLELGSGTGVGTRIVHRYTDFLVCCDLARAMLLHAPSDLAPRLQADASRLPFRSNSFDAVLMVNMLLFPGEVDRVLRPGGRVVWVNTLGDQTPIHLPPDDVAEALPGTWHGVTARAGSGFWAVLQRG